MRIEELREDQFGWLFGQKMVLTPEQMHCVVHAMLHPDLWENRQGWRGYQSLAHGIAVLHDYKERSYRIILKEERHD